MTGRVCFLFLSLSRARFVGVEDSIAVRCLTCRENRHGYILLNEPLFRHWSRQETERNRISCPTTRTRTMSAVLTEEQLGNTLACQGDVETNPSPSPGSFSISDHLPVHPSSFHLSREKVTSVSAQLVGFSSSLCLSLCVVSWQYWLSAKLMIEKSK